jgi:methionine-rich copper-binding protein CopC
LSDPTVLAQAIGSLNLSAGVLAAIAQGNTNIRASNSLTEVSQVQKTTVLAALNPTTDWVAPTVTAFNPATGTQAVPVSNDLVFELSEPAQRGSGTIELRTADGTLVQRFEAGSAAVTVQGNTLTLNPSADLTPSTGYVVVFAPNAFLDLAGNSFAGSGDFSFSTAQAQDGDDGSPPVATRFGPAGSTRSVALNDNLTLTFNELIQTGPGAIRLKTASGQLVETFTAVNATASGSTLTLNPTGNLDLFTRYVLELDPNAVRDLAGNGISAGLNYDFRTASADGLYHMFVAAFAAAPGVTYMGQLAEAYNHFNALSTQAGNATSTLQQIVEIFTTKSQFTSDFPETLSDRELAVRLVNRIVKTSATDAARTQAVQDIEAALGIGWSRGKMLYTVFGNVANMPLNDPTWGNTAQQFQNQMTVARYFTEVLAVDTTDLARLQGVLASITPDTDVSTVEKIVQIIGTVPPGG